MNLNSFIPRLTSLLFLFLSISFSSLFAQPGTIKGKIINGTNASLADINVSLKGLDFKWSGETLLPDSLIRNFLWQSAQQALSTSN